MLLTISLIITDPKTLLKALDYPLVVIKGYSRSLKPLIPHLFIGILIISSIAVSSTFMIPVSADEQSYEGPEYCGNCHPDIYDNWASSRHANAFSDSVFQSMWIQNERPGVCLVCHTTGFTPANGSYAFEGVTCESCHGGPGAMVTDISAELCGQCHSGAHRPSYEEWSQSAHSQSIQLLNSIGEEANVACLSCHSTEGYLGNLRNRNWNPEKATTPIVCSLCHDPHLSKLRVRPVTRLCGNCHEGSGHPQSDLRLSGPHSMMDVSCEECHMYKRAYESSLKPASTGHAFEIVKTNGRPLVCGACHGVIEGIPSEEAAIDELREVQSWYIKRNATAYSIILSATEAVKKANSTIYQNLGGQVYKSSLYNAFKLLNSSRRLLDEAEYVVNDFLPSDGSKGFHNPTIYHEMLAEAIQKAKHARSLAKAAETIVLLDLQASQARAEGKFLQRQTEVLSTALYTRAALILILAVLLGVMVVFIANVMKESRGDKRSVKQVLSMWIGGLAS